MTGRRAAVAAFLLAALAGCTIRSEREEVLPWLLKKSTHTALGGFGGSTQSTFYARHWGLWRALDAWNVLVLDADHVLVDREGSYAVLERGSLRAQLVCEKRMSLSVSLPPGPAAVDCVDAAAHDDGITGLAWRRFDPRGPKLAEQTVSVAGEGRTKRVSPTS